MKTKKQKPRARRPRSPHDVDLKELAAKVQARMPLTICEWCRKRRYSRATYDVLRATGRGPDVVQHTALGNVTISAEADDKWAAQNTRSGGEPLIQHAKTRSSRAAD